MSSNIDLTVERLLDPQFGSDTTERLLMGTAADTIRHLQGELAEAQAKVAHLAKQEVDIRAAYHIVRADNPHLSRENKRLEREWEAALAPVPEPEAEGEAGRPQFLAHEDGEYNGPSDVESEPIAPLIDQFANAVYFSVQAVADNGFDQAKSALRAAIASLREQNVKATVRLAEANAYGDAEAARATAAEAKLDRASQTALDLLAALTAAVSLLERTPKAKKAAPSDRMFEQMLADYRASLSRARQALSLAGEEQEKA